MTVLNKSINSIVNSLNEFETLLLIIDSSHEYILSPLIEEYKKMYSEKNKDKIKEQGTTYLKKLKE